jgi:hypothetical protein
VIHNTKWRGNTVNPLKLFTTCGFGQEWSKISKLFKSKKKLQKVYILAYTLNSSVDK